MKLSLHFPELTILRERIGAPLSDWTLGSPVMDPRKDLLDSLEGGIEINLGDVQPGIGGLLTYQGEQVILYIKDTKKDLWTLQNEPENSVRFHVADCRTLDDMRNKGRFERYVVTNRMDGLFKVDWLDKDTGQRGEIDAALKVCKNCLKTLNWRGYEVPPDRLVLPDGTRQVKGDIWKGFDISEFIMEYSTFFKSKPSRRDTNATLNEYVANWAKISERTRREAAWTCEQCKVDLSKRPGLLHCHHKNGVVTDNARSNLAVLCALCHAEQPDHRHMKVPLHQAEAIRNERLEQGCS